MIEEENYHDFVLFKDDIYHIRCPCCYHLSNYKVLLPLPQKMEFICNKCNYNFNLEGIIDEMLRQKVEQSIPNINKCELRIIVKLEPYYRIIFDVLIYKKFKVMFLLFDFLVKHNKIEKEHLKGFYVDLPIGKVHFGFKFLDSWRFFAFLFPPQSF